MENVAKFNELQSLGLPYLKWMICTWVQNMNLNQYTDKIIKILKGTSVDGITIWDIYGNDEDFRKNNLTKRHIELFDSVYMQDIKKLTKEKVIDLWKGTDACYFHEVSCFEETPEYEGDIFLDIREEILPLIALDINDFYK